MGNDFPPDGSFFSNRKAFLYHVTNGSKTTIKNVPDVQPYGQVAY
jgi:hypothetical protein